MRIVHLGLGNFFRAHAAVYTDQATDGALWGIAAFSGRSAALAEQLTVQDGLYTVVTRGPRQDRFDRVASISRAFAGTAHDDWLRCLRSPELACVTLTVTEFGYHRTADGRLDVASDEVARDLAALAADGHNPVTTAPARLVAGLLERRRVDGGPIAIVSCDNLPGNGAATRQVVRDVAELVDPSSCEWIDAQVSFPDSMVDRITPHPDVGLAGAVQAATGFADGCPVATEPFSEWVIAGDFPAGRPDWASSGATFATDIEPHERRKLRLLNGAHSLLAYVGLERGRQRVDEAIADDWCRDLVLRWWGEASPGLGLLERDVQDYCARLLERWANPRIGHELAQIAADGSQKLPIRVLPVIALQRAAGVLPDAAVAIMGAWVRYLRRVGTGARDGDLARLLPLVDGPPAVVARSILARLGAAHPELSADDELVAALAAQLS